MKKRLISLAAALCFCLTLLPVPAFAVVDPPDSSPYGLTIHSSYLVPVTDSNRSDVLGDGTVRYDPATGTLTLDQADLTRILYEGTGDLKIHSIGASRVHSIDSRSACTVTLSGRFVNPIDYSGNLSHLIVAGSLDSASTLAADALTITGTVGDVGYLNAIHMTISGTVGDALSIVATHITISGTVGDVENLIVNQDGSLTVTGTVGDITKGINALKASLTLAGHVGTVGTVGTVGGYGILAKTARIDGYVEAITGNLCGINAEDLTVATGITVWGSQVAVILSGRLILENVELATEGVEIRQVSENSISCSMDSIGNLVPQVTFRSTAAVVAIPMYWPTVESAAGGTVKPVPLAVSEGGTMHLLVKPAAGMELADLTVTDGAGNIIPVESTGENRWSFVQPGSEVTVTPTFRAETASRTDLVTLLWEQAGKPVVNYILPFSDLSQEADYAEAVRWAAAERLVHGHTDGTFGPQESLTREQAAAILYRLVQRSGGGFLGSWMFLLPCTDRAQVSDWAYEAVCWMTMNGILEIAPDGLFDPQGTLTPAELAELVEKLK